MDLRISDHTNEEGGNIWEDDKNVLTTNTPYVRRPINGRSWYE